MKNKKRKKKKKGLLEAAPCAQQIPLYISSLFGMCGSREPSKITHLPVLPESC